MKLKNGFRTVKLGESSPLFIDILSKSWPSHENNLDAQDCATRQALIRWNTSLKLSYCVYACIVHTFLGPIMCCHLIGQCHIISQYHIISLMGYYYILACQGSHHSGKTKPRTTTHWYQSHIIHVKPSARPHQDYRITTLFTYIVLFTYMVLFTYTILAFMSFPKVFSYFELKNAIDFAV